MRRGHAALQRTLRLVLAALRVPRLLQMPPDGEVLWRTQRRLPEAGAGSGHITQELLATALAKPHKSVGLESRPLQIVCKTVRPAIGLNFCLFEGIVQLCSISDFHTQLNASWGESSDTER